MSNPPSVEERAQVHRHGRRRAFSLIELVIVLVIIAIVGAITIPQMSRGASSAADSALVGDLAVLRKAIDHYAAEHGESFPTSDKIQAQLTLYSDVSGASSQATPDQTHLYGPYLRSIPILSIGQRKGASGIGASDGPTIGWIYNETTGTIRANTISGEADPTSKPYYRY